MAEIFSKDPQLWDQNQRDKAQQFLKCNSFFDEIYEQKYVGELLKMAYYIKMQPNQQVYLTHNKRPVCVILLAGCIEVHQKGIGQQHPRHKSKNKKQENEGEFSKFAQLISYNDTITLNSECKLVSMHNLPSQCIFVPSFLYNKYMHEREEEKNNVTFEQLSKNFKITEKKPILNLAKSGCEIKEYQINNYLYRKGDSPQFIYIILEGSVKVGELDGYMKKGQNRSIKIMSNNTIVGDEDLCENQRVTNAMCCSSHVKSIKIPKQAYLKFAKHYLPSTYEKIIKNSKKEKVSPKPNKRYSSRLIDRSSDKEKLPSIFRYKSSMKNPEELEKQYKLIKNSHILLDASPPKIQRIRSKSAIDDYPHDIMYKKSKLFKKIRPNARPLDLSNRIF